jgi:hypothetical protein
MKKLNPQTAAARLKKISPLRPTLAIVLGSGFHHALTELRAAKKFSYAKIPGFPKPTVSGHAHAGGLRYFGVSNLEKSCGVRFPVRKEKEDQRGRPGDDDGDKRCRPLWENRFADLHVRRDG